MPKQIWLLIIGTVINITGASFIWPLNTIYMHNELGKSLAFAGVILMINQGFAIIGNLIGGVLFDKMGGYRTILTGTSIAMTSSFSLVLFHDIYQYAVFLIIIGLGSGITRPAMFALASSVWPEGRAKAFNALYVAQNLGVAIGASIGGYVASISFSYIFIANAILFLFFFLLAVNTFKPLGEKQDAYSYSSVLDHHKKIENKANFRALVILSVGFFISWMAYVQWQTTIASFTQDIGIPLSSYSTLWTINGLLIVLGQPMIRIITRAIPSSKKQIYIGTSIFLLSFISLLFADTFPAFVMAMVILTLGEMLVWPAVPTLADKLAPKGRAGFYQGIINSVSTSGRMIGPIIGGFVVDQWNIQSLFYAFILLMFIPFFSTYYYDKGLSHKKDESARSV
ncbi:MFS transporter [Aquibacillus sp. 3ASR75-11]|uniref:MFS transporter n=1 Tax=Terrihalobacillus insolitus TaxID=2950438 RepID=A0A9X4ALP7_9BACI|nr:MFS transporter [Terrihalobacillus insolitus]MDC3424466.1 MFS transporter [Terrihalobacillus insolitus]